MTESDTDLIRRAQANDLDAFCLLAERYARRIHLLALHYCRNAQDAEDLSQEVWLKAYQALASFRSDSSFYTWLRRITINAFLNHRRSGFFRRRGQTTVVQLLQIDADEVLEQSASPENIYNKLLLENVGKGARGIDSFAATRVSASTLRRNVVRGNRNCDELFHRNSQERCFARDWKTPKKAFARREHCRRSSDNAC